MSKETLATKVLPFWLPLCVEQSFSPKQYELLVSLVNDMITQITMEHREALQQLQKTRQFAENMTDSLNMASPTSSSTNSITSLNPLGMFESNTFASPTQNNSQTPTSRTLSLEEKHR